MAQVKIPLTGDCNDPAFQQQLVDFHEIPVKTFVDLVVDYFEVYPFPKPKEILVTEILQSIDGVNCAFEVMRVKGDFTLMSNDDITYSIGVPMEDNYSLGLLRGILTRFPAAISFNFYKAFCPACQKFSIIFQVWDGTQSLYNGDFSNSLP